VDSGVLFGPSVTTLGLQTIAGVPIDGEIGAKTLAVLSQLDPRTVTNSLAIWRIKRHANRCSVDPSQVIFLKGWINRACSFIE
jgi:lysozyme family protein